MSSADPGIDTAIIVACAGVGSRFRNAGGSGHKLLAEAGGAPLARQTLSRAHQASAEWQLPIVAVFNADWDERTIESLLSGLERACHVIAHDASEGLHATLACGLAHARDGLMARHALILLGDDPLATGDIMRILEVANREPSAQAVGVARTVGGPHPVFLRDIKNAQLGAVGRGNLDRLGRVIWVPGPDTVDADRPQDLVELEARLVRSRP